MKDNFISTDIKTKILNEGFIEPTVSHIDEIPLIIENGNLSGDIIEIEYNKTKLFLVFDALLNGLYNRWSKVLNKFVITFTTGEADARKSYFILPESSEGLINAKAKLYPAQEPTS
jgi:hypothetical protein